MVMEKQLVLKPQDLVLTLKIAVNREREFTLTQLSDELETALSGVHASIKRSEQARLISRSAGSIRALRASVKEFVLYGAKYAFPGLLGALTKGVPTAIAGPMLRDHFENPDSLPPVWPDPNGQAYGPSLVPLHPSVPAACRNDLKLLRALTLFDALRVGAAREREIATVAIEEILG